MNQASRGSRVVFGKSNPGLDIWVLYRSLQRIIVGNIPFELTEEQLIDIFKEVGPVQSFR